MSDQAPVANAAAPALAPIESAPTENLETTESTDEGQELSGEEVRSDAAIEADKTLTKKEKAEEKRIKKLTLKYNGKEYDQDLPFEIPDTEDARGFMTEHLQKSKLSQSKSQESAEMKATFNEFLELLKEDPAAILSDPTIGIDIKKFAAKIIEQEIENSKKSPEQKALEDAQKELKRLKDETEKEKKTSKEREQKKLMEQYHSQFEKELTEALDTAKIPMSPSVVNRVVDYVEFGRQNKLPVSISEVLPMVREEMKNDFKHLLNSMSEDDVEEFVGKEILNKIRKKNLKKAKETPVPTPVKAAVKDVGQAPKGEQKPVAKKSFKDFFGV